MPDRECRELIDHLATETAMDPATASDVAVLVTAALLAASSRDLLADAMQAASTTADRQFVAIAAAHLAGDHDRVDALARDHLLDHPLRPVLGWIVDHNQPRSNEQGAHR